MLHWDPELRLERQDLQKLVEVQQVFEGEKRAQFRRVEVTKLVEFKVTLEKRKTSL